MLHSYVYDLIQMIILIIQRKDFEILDEIQYQRRKTILFDQCLSYLVNVRQFHKNEEQIEHLQVFLLRLLVILLFSLKFNCVGKL